MAVYKPKNSPYFHYDFVRKGVRYHGSTGLRSRRQAEAFEDRERHKAALPKLERPTITVDEACGLYSERAERQPSWPTTRYMLASLVSGLGPSTLLSEVTQLQLDSFFAKRRNGRSNATVNREIDNARAVWRTADKARFDVGEMPDWGALRLKVPKVTRPELTFEQEPALFQAMRTDLIDVCDFALKSGWRKAEVMGLRWADCDLQGGYATTRIKGGDVVRRPLTATLIAIIANQPRVGPFVFTYICQKSRAKRRAGQRYPMTATVLRKPWAEAKKAAKIEGFRFHDLRHTRGTRIVRATGSLAAAKEALKHSDLKTTLRYAHVLEGDVRRALDVSDDASESRNSPEAPASRRKKG